jgi:hypothetical protein
MSEAPTGGFPQETPVPGPAAAEAAASPEARVGAAMGDINGMVETHFVTDAHRAAFMTSVEVHLGPDGRITYVPDPASPAYRGINIVRYMAVNGPDGPTAADLKVHQPQNAPDMSEYTRKFKAAAGGEPEAVTVSVQRGADLSASSEAPGREEDATYTEWVRDALRAQLGDAADELAIEGDYDVDAMVKNQYTDPSAAISEHVGDRPAETGGYAEPGVVLSGLTEQDRTVAQPATPGGQQPAPGGEQQQ